MTQAIEQAVCDILGACQPVKIILYAEKRTMATDKLKAFSLCIIVPESANCRTLRTHLHLAITVSVPCQSERLHHRGMGGALHGQYLVCRMDRPERQGDL